MKKLSFITILLLGVLIYPLSVSAIDMIYTSTGTFELDAAATDFLGYDQKPFVLEFTIDSNKPQDNPPNNFSEYTPDSVTFTVDGVAQTLTSPTLSLSKESNFDFVVMVGNINGTELLSIGHVFDPCTLGTDYPIPTLQRLSSNDTSYRGTTGYINLNADLSTDYIPTNNAFSASPVPVPSTLLLLGTGLFCLASYGRRKRT